jgi:hypothetical protein
MMAKAWNRMRGNRSQEYTPLPLSEKEPPSPRKTRHTRFSLWSIVGLIACGTGTLLALYGLFRYAEATLYTLLA